VADPRPRDRVIVLGKYQVVVGGEICSEFVEDVRVLPEHMRLRLGRRTPFVERNDLLVQVIERRTGGAEPVLKDADVAT